MLIPNEPPSAQCSPQWSGPNVTFLCSYHAILKEPGRGAQVASLARYKTEEKAIAALTFYYSAEHVKLPLNLEWIESCVANLNNFQTSCCSGL